MGTSCETSTASRGFDLTRVLIFTIALLTTLVAPAQARFSFFRPSMLESVERRLKLANLRGDDVIVDFDPPKV